MYQVWLNMRYSFWFLPVLFMIGAVFLAIAIIDLDSRLAPDFLEEWPKLFGAGSEGARGLLSTVASSIITVAGVVFSITLVVLTSASSQYTSRVLRNFMSDWGNQAALGGFVGIFTYCLVVLRTIRGGDEGGFVPSIAVLVGLVLGLFGIVLLIWFIHHISVSIQASSILSAITHDTLVSVDKLFPEGVGEEESDSKKALDKDQGWITVEADETGYIQGMDADGLLDFANEHDLVIRMERRIGQFVIKDTPIASVLGTAPGKKAKNGIGSFYSVGPQRTVEQDAVFGIDQLVDIALKALSPGVNDTTTALMCIDRLTEILVRLTDRQIESAHRGEDGKLRLLTLGPTYSGMVEQAIDPIRRNAAGNLAVLQRLVDSLELLSGRTKSPLRRKILLRHAQSLIESCEQCDTVPRDRQWLDEHLTCLKIALPELTSVQGLMAADGAAK
jgi:uncharacterized membrane protein